MTLELLGGRRYNMAYFAQINDNNIVQQVISINNAVLNEPSLEFPDTEILGQEFISNILGLPGVWLQTSFNNSFRNRYAGVGYYYDASKDWFIPPQPFPSWILDEYGNWNPPITYPIDGQNYIWNEESQNWIIML